MSKVDIKTSIDVNIKQNNNQEITGNILNSVLKLMVDDYAEQVQVDGLNLSKLDKSAFNDFKVETEGTFSAIIDQVNNYKPIEINNSGIINNQPDEEDLTAENDLLKFKDRSAINGMGYVILRRNALVEDQIIEEDTIYEVRYDFDLNGQTIDVPNGSIIKFNGGSINNGTLNIGTNVRILGNGEKMSELFITHTSDVSNIIIDRLEFYGRLVDSSSSVASDLTYCIKSLNYKRANNVQITNCVIHNYNTGIALTGDNVTIANNLLYGNGALNTPSGVHDQEVDIMFLGQYITEVDYKDNIISHNRCLSQYVHRNIDAGENYWFNNIIIDGNICVSCDNSFNEVVRARKSQCILVGYSGSSSREKQVVITNNICKNCSWGAIYVRASNTEQTADTTKYVALITNNIVENVYRGSTGHICGGILSEIKDGSEISNNFISNIYDEISSVPSAAAISLGFVYSKSRSYVHDNVIKNFAIGIVNDSFAKHVDICRNRLYNGGYGIVIGDAARSVTEPVVGEETYIDGNLLFNMASRAISVDSIYGKTIIVVNNTIVGSGKSGSSAPTNTGIYARGRFQTIFPILIENNKLINLYRGVYLTDSSFLRNEISKTFVNHNYYQSCAVALYVGVNARYQLFVTEGNIYDDCDSKFGDQSWSRCVYDGVIRPNGTYEIYDDGGRGDISNSAYGYITNAPVCFYDKLFKKGDRIITSDSRYFDEAICSADYASHSDHGALWRVLGGRLSASQSAITALVGAYFYDTTLKKMKLWNGSAWVNLDGSAL